MTKVVLNSALSTYDVGIINANFAKIQAQFQDKVLYRDNPVGEPNTLETDVNANNKRIYNLPEPTTSGEPLRLEDLENVAGDLQDAVEASEDAQAAAASANVSASSALSSQSNAATSAAEALVSELDAENAASSAAGSANTATIQANIAITKAAEAAASASAASTSATSAATSAAAAAGAVTDHINDSVDAHISSAIGFTQAGTGAISKTVQSKLREWVSVKDFGAIGDGVTSDSAAIQLAENYASANSLSVYFPAGIYLCSVVIYRKGNTDWIGDGMYQSILKHSGGAATHHLIHVVDAAVEYSHIGFYGLGFDGNRSGSASPTVDRIVVYLDRDASGGDDAPSEDVRFIGCRLFNFSYGNMGLHIKGYTGVQVKDNVFSDGGGATLFHPVYLRRCPDAIVTGNTSTGRDSNTCIKVQLSPRSIVSNNICRDGGRGINAQDMDAVTLTSNVCTDQTEYGIACTIETASLTLSPVVSGNSISNAASGMLISNVGFPIVAANAITGFSTRGIYFRGALDGVCNGNTLCTTDGSTNTIDFIAFEAGPTPSRMVCNSNHLRALRTGVNVTNGFWSDEADTSGIALLGNRLSGSFDAEYSGINNLLDLPSYGQIKFPATQNPSSDANTLDDYEEGVFTPFLRGTSTPGTGTYTSQVGRYSKIGRRVFFQFNLVWTAHTGTGNMRLDGLPFTTNSVANSVSAVSFGRVVDVSLTAGSVLAGYTLTNTTQIALEQIPSGGGASTLVPMDTAGTLVVSGHYEASA